MGMAADERKKRTKAFAIPVLKLVQVSPDIGPAFTIGGQLLRAGTSVGSNFRAACRARSRADFIAKLKIVEKECDESIYWLALLDFLNAKADYPPPRLDGGSGPNPFNRGCLNKNRPQEPIAHHALSCAQPSTR
jgi:four helix bundle protein